MVEECKAIKGYEKYYEVSTQGNVRSLDRELAAPHNSKKVSKGKVLVPRHNSNTPYYYVCLCVDNKRKNYSIHRLVAEMFIPNPENKAEVNHIDGNPLNNNISNLEWVTRNENLKHSYRVCNRQSTFTRRRKRVLCVETGMIYDSIIEASRKTKIYKSCIAHAVRGIAHTAGGYHWIEVQGKTEAQKGKEE